MQNKLIVVSKKCKFEQVLTMIMTKNIGLEPKGQMAHAKLLPSYKPQKMEHLE
jgi:hypothetical protein